MFAVIGCASGLGNAFRFPSLCAQYGLAFVVAYAVMLAAVCLPLLCAELYFGRAIHGSKGRKVWGVILRVATLNSAFIAAYYGVICAKLGTACASFALFSDGERGGNALFAVMLVLLLFAVFLLLRGGNKVLARTGKITVIGSLASFALLAVLGLARGNCLPKADFARLAGGAVWADALGQALLALSLASGVMPAFSRTHGVRVVPASLAIVGCNLLGCVLSALATAPYIPFIAETVGVSCGLKLYNSAIFTLFSGKIARSVAGVAVFAVLTLVAIHSLCSLAYPLVAKLTEKFSRAAPNNGNGGKIIGKVLNVKWLAPALFCLFSGGLAPLFACRNMQVLTACDQMACSVTAVTVAFAESVYFALSCRPILRSLRHIRGVIAFFTQFFCPSVTGALALFSLCSARFNCFLPLATAIAYISVTAIALTATLPQLTFFAKRITISIRQKARR